MSTEHPCSDQCRRSGARAPVSIPITVRAPGLSAVTSTLNVSARGALIRAVPGLSENTVVHVRVLLARGPLEFRARVVRAQREFWALEFQEAAPEVMRQLEEAVETRLRELQPGPA